MEGWSMTKIISAIEIGAPVEKVFAYAADPMMTPEWIVGVMEASDVIGSGKGLRFSYTYKMLGIPFQGQTERVGYALNERIVDESTGGIPSTLTWTFTPYESGTKVEVEIDYTIPVPVLGKMAEKLVMRRNEREVDMWMENLKERLEV
jgi:uncharacterized membrane protein